MEMLGEIIKIGGNYHIVSIRMPYNGRYVYNEETGNITKFDEALKNQGWKRLVLVEASEDRELNLPYIPLPVIKEHESDTEKTRVSITFGEHEHKKLVSNRTIAEVAAVSSANSVADAYSSKWNDEYDRVYNAKLEELEKENPDIQMLPCVSPHSVLVCKLIPKYVVLEHLTLPDRGFRFWTTNTLYNTKMKNGEEAYKEVFLTDNQEEAINESQNYNRSAIPTTSELMEYYKDPNNR